MWNKRREDEFPSRPPSTTSGMPDFANREPAPTPTPAYSPSPRPAEPEAPRGVASIGKSVILKGQIFSREDLYLDGEMEGTVEVPEHRLTVGPHGKIHAASIKAREVVVLGTVTGNVEASERLDIRKEAKLVGDVRTGRIIIEDGAYFKGSIDIVRQEAAKPAPATRQPAQQPSPTPVSPVPAAVGEIKR
jgi:cytoskeletal protein CcmA (bactofilin family)